MTLKINDFFYLVDKLPGETTKDCVDKFKKQMGAKKACFHGRLDPMARGQLPILLDDDCKKMDLLKACSKEYEVEIIFGVQTDTDDDLGIITKTSDIKIKNIIDVLKKLKNYDKKIIQKFHKWSSIPIKNQKRKPYWLCTKEGINVESPPTHQVEIFNITLLDIIQRRFSTFKDNVTGIINSLDRKHDFRQDEIIGNWNNLEFNDNIWSIKVKLNVSSGFYVRQFVRDISKELEYPLMAWDIHRCKFNY